MAAWQAAYEQEPRELYIFEIAESARRAGLINEAQASYQRFLRESSATDYIEQRKQAEEQLLVLRQQIERKSWPSGRSTSAGGSGRRSASASRRLSPRAWGAVASQPMNLIGDLPTDRQRTLESPP